jgi:hypothetical protein
MRDGLDGKSQDLHRAIGQGASVFAHERAK